MQINIGKPFLIETEIIEFEKKNIMEDRLKMRIIDRFSA